MYGLLRLIVGSAVNAICGGSLFRYACLQVSVQNHISSLGDNAITVFKNDVSCKDPGLAHD
jgi:hypothetical protein